MNIFDVIGPVMIGPSSSAYGWSRTFIVIGDQHSGGLAAKGCRLLCMGALLKLTAAMARIWRFLRD